MARPKKVNAEDPKTEGLIRCTVLRDYWLDPEPNGDEVRVKANTLVEVTAEEAMDGIEAGRLVRVRD